MMQEFGLRVEEATGVPYDNQERYVRSVLVTA